MQYKLQWDIRALLLSREVEVEMVVQVKVRVKVDRVCQRGSWDRGSAWVNLGPARVDLESARTDLRTTRIYLVGLAGIDRD